ncbi:MAG: RNA polymerase sigma factor [Chloroflexota bacterium]
MDERDLLTRIAAGDSEAANEICAHWLDPVYRFIRAHSGCPPEEAEDIVQETFVAFLRSVHAFRGEASIYTWLCAIARRKIIDYYRSQGRRARHSAGPLDERLQVLASDQPLPEECIADAELRQAVLAEVWQLPDHQRQALLDKYVAAKSTAEMARDYGKTVKAVESLLGRARDALRRRLASEPDPDGVGGGDRVTRPIRGEPVTLARRRG